MDPSFTEVIVGERIESPIPAPLPEAIVADSSSLFAAFLAHSTGTCCVVVSPEGTIRYGNPAFDALLELGPNGAAGLPLARFLTEPDALYVAACVAGGRHARSTPLLLTFLRQNGMPTTLRCDLDIHGGELVIIGEPDREANATLQQLLVDLNRQLTVTARENVLQTRELERQNRELQDFASIASHDLQEPLRKIRAFADRLTLACGDALPADARDSLARIHSAASRMSTLIADLLGLARSRTGGNSFEYLDLRTIATAVVIDLEEAIARAGATVVIGALPSLHADATQMRQLLQNLIGNAVKYHGAQGSAVTVYAEPLPHGCRMVVDDNGIGFAPADAERIFDPFQRLHARSEYEGTGIGLALCRRIMERHGGTINAVSRPGGGARFITTFPEARSRAEV